MHVASHICPGEVLYPELINSGYVDSVSIEPEFAARRFTLNPSDFEENQFFPLTFDQNGPMLRSNVD
jgi:hypothetical protein